MKKSQSNTGSLSGSENSGVEPELLHLAFNREAFIIVCVEMKIITKNGNTFEQIRFEQGWLKRLRSGHIKAF
jgi:hypothetical protein